jgi:hypothetical protein
MYCRKKQRYKTQRSGCTTRTAHATIMQQLQATMAVSHREAVYKLLSLLKMPQITQKLHRQKQQQFPGTTAATGT